MKVQHKFVEFIPKNLDQKTLYVSVEYGTVLHLCLCGCGEEVVTPLSPTDWKLTYDGESISLHPSIGNWNFNCRSHYWVRKNKVTWAESWSEEEVRFGREFDRLNKNDFYNETDHIIDESQTSKSPADSLPFGDGLWERFKRLWQ